MQNKFLKEGEMSPRRASPPNWASSPPCEQLLSIREKSNHKIFCSMANKFAMMKVLQELRIYE